MFKLISLTFFIVTVFLLVQVTKTMASGKDSIEYGSTKSNIEKDAAKHLINPAEQRSNVKIKLIDQDKVSNIGVCFKEGEAKVVTSQKDIVGCTSFSWLNVKTWLVNEAKLLTNSYSDKMAARPIDPEPRITCSSCSAICQTISWVADASIYSEHNIGANLTPSQCVDTSVSVCEAGYSRFLFSSNCTF